MVETFCKTHNITIDQFYGRTPIEGSLDLDSLTSIPKGFNPTVGGYLYLSSLTSIPKGFNPTVGGYLNLSSLTSIPKGFNPTVGGYLYLSSLTSIPKGFNPTVGGSLDLSSLTSIPKGFNPTVGGYLNLSSLTSIPKGFNPTVGRSLYLRSLTSIPKGFNPTVGGYLYLPTGLTCVHTPLGTRILQWQDGKWIIADGIFTEVLEHRGNVYKVRKIGATAITYLVTNGVYHAHGDTLKRAKEDLRHKIQVETVRSTPIGVGDLVTVEHYRIVTGACYGGIRGWLDANHVPYYMQGDVPVETSPMAAGDLVRLLEKTSAYGVDNFKKLLQLSNV